MGRGRVSGLMVLLLALAPVALAAQGWIEPPMGGVGFHVDKVRSEVRVRLDGRVAHVEVSEYFRNAGVRLAEGHYLYPLPGEAVFRGFSLFQGDAELRGEIMDAARAREIYEEIVRRRADPALIELAGHGLLRARVFPIEPGQERKVTLRYTQVLSRAGDALQLVYAGAVRGEPRSQPRPQNSDGRRPLPEAVETTFEVVAENGGAFLDPFSPTHTLEVRRGGGRLTVRVEEEVVGRLSLFLPLAGEAVGLSVATHRPQGEDGYFMLTLSPGEESGGTAARDLTVVLDVSGSMSGAKIAQAKSALRGFLSTLGESDRFRLVAFSNAVRRHASEWVEATPRELDRARGWVDDLVADGGTNIEAALDEAFRLDSPEGRLPMVIFLTDGLPSVGEESPERLADRAENQAGRTRVFAFGVGHDVNTHLLDRLGEAGRGSTQYVEPGEDVERAISLLAAKIRHPVLTDLRLGGSPVDFDEVYPVRIPDVFAGEELLLFGRYVGDGSGQVRVIGSRGGSRASFGAEASFPRASEANAYIPRLWASRKLGHLTRQIWTEGETPHLVEEIRTLALRYGLPSEYTSYLVQEPEVLADMDAPLGVRLLRPNARQRSAMPAVSAASGAGAVRRAQEARSLRDAASLAKLESAEEQIMLAMFSPSEARPTRMVAGRIFLLDAGVWTDARHEEGSAIVQIKVFSKAYFELLDTVPELRRILKEMSEAVVAGEEVSIHFGTGGIEEMNEPAMTSLVRRFSGGPVSP